jgi:hypothetical protein
MITEVKVIRFSEDPTNVRYHLFVGNEYKKGFDTEAEALIAAKNIEIAIAANYPRTEIIYQSKIEHTA